MSKRQRTHINEYGLRIFIFMVFFLSIFVLYLYRENSKLEDYITLVQGKYNIASHKSVQERIRTNFTFSRSDAFGIIFIDLPKILPNKFSLDPNFTKYFAWEQNGKLIDLTEKSVHFNIGIPLMPNDTENDSPWNIIYVMNVFNDLQSVFQKNGFIKDIQFNEISVPTFSNTTYEKFAAYINKHGTKCSIYYPDRCDYSFDSLRISSGRAFCTYAFIYVVCAN